MQTHPYKQTFRAATLRAAIQLIQDELGSDAIILSTEQTPDGIQIEAAPSPAKTHKSPSLSAKDPGLASSQDDNQVLMALRSELSHLRQLVQQQKQAQASPAVSQNIDPSHNSLQERVAAYLEQYGFDHTYCQNIVNSLTEQQNFDQALAYAAQRISEDLLTTPEDLIDHQGAIALVGPTGVGKTTTLAKLAARFTMRYSRDEIGLISSDFYRVAGREQLRIYGKILGVPIHLVNNIQDLDDALEQLRDKRLVLIDTAGVSPRDIRLTQKMNLITQSKRALSTYLVFSATSQAGVIQQAIDAFRSDQLSGAIVTKLDECTQLGHALSVCIRARLPIAYLSTGQNVPEDLSRARSANLVKQAIQQTTKIKELS